MKRTCSHCGKQKAFYPAEKRKRIRRRYMKRTGVIFEFKETFQLCRDERGRAWDHLVCPACVLVAQRENYRRRIETRGYGRKWTYERTKNET